MLNLVEDFLQMKFKFVCEIYQRVMNIRSYVREGSTSQDRHYLG